MTQKNQQIQRLSTLRKISLMITLFAIWSNNIQAQQSSCPKALEIIKVDTNILLRYDLIFTIDVCTNDTIRILSFKRGMHKNGIMGIINRRLYCELATLDKLKLDEADKYLSITGREFSIDKNGVNVLIKKSSESLYESPQIDKALFNK